MVNEKKSLKANAIINGFRTVLNLIFPLITFPYISRVLSIEEIGKYNFSDSFVSYFLLIAALGINQYAVREGSKIRNSPKEMGEFASKVFSINMISTFVSYILLFILVAISDKLQNYWICISILSIQIVFTTIGTDWIYSIYEEYTYITVRSIIFKIISIILLFTFVRNKGDYLIYSLITVFASVGSNIINCYNARKYCHIRFTLDFDWREILKPILVIFASNVAIQIYVNLDITMLGFMGNDYSVGIYSISTKIYTIIKNVITAILTVTIPRFSLYIGKREYDKFYSLLQNVINLLIIIIIPSIVGIILLCNNVISIVAGENYLSARPSLCILSTAILFSVFNGLLSQCVLLSLKKEKVILQCTIISAFINVILNFVFIPLFKEVGAAITTLISEFVLCLILYLKAKDDVVQIFLSTKTKRNVLSVLLSTIIMLLTCLIVINNIHEFYLQTFCAITISIIIYTISLIIFRNEIIHSYLKLFLSKIKNNLC